MAAMEASEELADGTNPSYASWSSRVGSFLLPTRLRTIQRMWDRISPGPVLFMKQM